MFDSAIELRRLVSVVILLVLTGAVTSCGSDAGPGAGLSDSVDEFAQPYLDAAVSAMEAEMDPEGPFYDTNFCRGQVSVATMPVWILEQRSADESFSATQAGLEWNLLYTARPDEYELATGTIQAAQNACIEAGGDAEIALQIVRPSYDETDVETPDVTNETAQRFVDHYNAGRYDDMIEMFVNPAVQDAEDMRFLVGPDETLEVVACSVSSCLLSYSVWELRLSGDRVESLDWVGG